MKFNNLINTFASGEWSVKAKGRTETPEYANACEVLTNFLPSLTGGIFRRPGTTFFTNSVTTTFLAASVDTSYRRAMSRLIPVYSDSGVSLIFVGNTFPTGTWGVLTQPNAQTGRTALTATTGANIAGDGKHAVYNNITAFARPYRRPAIFKPSTSVGTDINMSTLEDYWATNFKWRATPYIPFENFNGSGTTLTASATTGAITITASASVFTPQDAGKFLKLSNTTSTGVVELTSYSSATVMNATVRITLPTTTPYPAQEVEESAWNEKYGYPTTVTAHEGRLVWGASPTFPGTIWGSRIGDIYWYDEIPLKQEADYLTFASDNSRAFTLVPNMGKTAEIRHLTTVGTAIMILTSTEEILGFGTNGAFGPLDASFSSPTAYGCSNTEPLRLGKDLFFVENNGRVIRNFKFNGDTLEYTSQTYSFLTDHLTFMNLESDLRKDLFEKVDYFTNLQGISVVNGVYLFAQTRSGKLYCLTLDSDYKLAAWSRIVLGGKCLTSASESGGPPVIKTLFAYGDTVNLITQRQSTSSDILVQEYIKIGDADDYSEYHFDLGGEEAPYSTSIIDVNVANQTVLVIADGTYVGTRNANASGSFGVYTVDDVFASVKYGIPFESYVKTFPIEIGQQIPGTPQNLIKRIDELKIKFYKTRGCFYGTKDSDLTEINFNEITEIETQAPPMFTGIKKVIMGANYAEEVQVIIKTSGPFPCNVLSITARGVLYD